MDRRLPVIPETQRLEYSSLDSRYPVETRLPIVLSQYPSISEIRYPEHRLSDPRYSPSRHIFPTSRTIGYQPSSSNLAILEESRAISTLTHSTIHSNYPLISPDYFRLINPPSSIPSMPTSSVLTPAFLYPHLYSSPPQNRSSLYLSAGEGRTYEILGQRSSDIPVRVDRGSVISSHRSIDSSHRMTEPSHRVLVDVPSSRILEEEARDNRSQSGLPQSLSATRSNELSRAPEGDSHSRPGPHDASDSSSVWRPY